MDILALPVRFAKGPLYHLLYLMSVAGFISLGLNVTPDSPWLVYGSIAMLIAAILHKYLTTVYALVVGADHLEIRYPLKTIRVGYGRISVLQVRYPAVGVLLNGIRKPIWLWRVGVDSDRLYRILSRQKELKGDSPNFTLGEGASRATTT